jgi:NADH-quinone oxidoreductase subunit M
MLLPLILIPLVFALLIALSPEGKSRGLAMLGTLIAAGATTVALVLYPWSESDAFNFAMEMVWNESLGLRLSLGADSISMILIALTALLGPICVAASTTAITERRKTYYAWLLVLQAAMTGVFASRDIILFYICFEFTLVPMYILISLWGSTNRKRAAVKFFLYTFTGSVIALAGLVYVAWWSAARRGEWSFDIGVLAEAGAQMPASSQAWVLLALMLGFAVKVPLFPLHTWLPLAHTEAPTAGSVILAGVLLKLGTYGLYRFALPFAPAAAVEYSPLIAVLCIIGIIYDGLICWVQTDVKKLVAYSSVAHLGFCVLGLFSLNNTGITGSVLYMINHGLSTGALFLLIGMIYERYHTRSMKELGGLASKMPVWATFMVFFAMASVGLPGLNGFVSEFLCLIGAFQASSAWGSGLWGSIGGPPVGATPGNLGPWFAAVAGIGMIIAAMYLLYMVGRVVFGPLVEPHGHDSHGSHGGSHGGAGGAAHAETGVLPTDLNLREILTLTPLAVLCIALGVYPKPVLDVIQPPISDTVRVLEAASQPVPTPLATDAPMGEEGAR